MIYLGTLLLALAPLPWTPAQTAVLGQRIAITHDGNLVDPDDIGASAMHQALIWRAGIQDRLVHFDFGNNLGTTDFAQHAEMIISCTRGLHLFDISSRLVHDAVAAQQVAIQSMRKAIEASTPTNRLVILQGGPWELMARAFDVADPATHRYVRIVSHSEWNDTWWAHPSHRTRDKFFAQYTSGQFAGVVPPAYTKIADQNWTAFFMPPHHWEWMSFTPQTSFVLHRTLASGPAAGDMSDAGMLFWLLTGNESASMSDIQQFFGFGS